MYKDWDNFVASHPLGTIHQTSFWGEFQSRTPGRDKYFVIEVGAGTAKYG
ncbi:hypothetical protein HZA39_02835 [Candidatus Peregrinibacteria bacterium]|nr:hypothetical protein [Candidatus Peregrinibacteria bacterium]